MLERFKRWIAQYDRAVQFSRRSNVVPAYRGLLLAERLLLFFLGSTVLIFETPARWVENLRTCVVD